MSTLLHAFPQPVKFMLCISCHLADLEGSFSRLRHNSHKISFPLPDPIPQAQCLLFISSYNVCTVYLEKNMILSSFPTCGGILLLQGFCEEQSSTYRGHLLFLHFAKKFIDWCPNTVLQLQHQKPPGLQTGKTKIILSLDFCHGWAAHWDNSTDQRYGAVSIQGGIEQLRIYFGKETTEKE